MKIIIKNNRISIKGLIFISSLLLILFIWILAINQKGLYDNELVFITNGLIIIYAILHVIFPDQRSYSAIKMFYLFVFFFMGFAPLMQYKYGTETVGGYKITERTYIQVNLIIFFICLVFDFVYLYSYKFCKPFKLKNFTYFTPKNKKNWRNVLLSISLFSVIIIFIHFSKSPLLLVFRGLGDLLPEETLTNVDESKFNFIFNCLFRPIPIICAINYLVLDNNKKYKIIFILLALIGCFPTSVARLFAAAYYIPIILLLFPFLRRNNNFIKFFIFGFLIIFPLLNSFRYWGGGINFISLDFEMFCNINYDSYQSLAWVYQNNYITNGRQLLVVLFFWIPRAVWPDKPFFSASTVADEFNLSFRNISMNYWGEGYLNFGIIGIILFTIFLAYITSKFDKTYFKKYKGNINSLFSPFFLIFIGMYFFFMRGDLMFGVEYTLSLMLLTYIIYRINLRFLTIK